MPPRKSQPTENAADLETRGAEETETLPVPDFDATGIGDDSFFLGGMGQPMPDPSITAPPDSTDAIVEDNASVESMLTYKEVSITELFSDGTRGIRLFLGKPTMGTFDVMRARSKGVGVVIEADGASVEHRK